MFDLIGQFSTKSFIVGWFRYNYDESAIIRRISLYLRNDIPSSSFRFYYTLLTHAFVVTVNDIINLQSLQLTVLQFRKANSLYAVDLSLWLLVFLQKILQ